MDTPTKPSLLRRLLGSITGARPGDPPRAAVRDARRAIWLCHALLSERGDVAGARLARETLAAYQGLEDLALGVFFDLLIKEFSPDPQDVVRVADAYRQDPSQPNLIRLQRAVEPRRQELFRRLNTVGGGTAVLLEMRRRLQADRRCYAFFHPVLPDEPVIFIEVALTRGVSTRVQPLLELNSEVADPASADCAIFYSITNCQEGLRGVSFGNLLIKQVAEDLGREFPRLKTFATLSPVPGFRQWLVEKSVECPALGELLARIDAPGWLDEAAAAAEIQRQLIRLCAHYLLYAKQGRDPLDPVARFHLGNGARLERLNWLGDTSPSGMRRAAGLMVNYVYRLGEVERNHEAYARDGRVAAARRFEVLARESLVARRDAA